MGMTPSLPTPLLPRHPPPGTSFLLFSRFPRSTRRRPSPSGNSLMNCTRPRACTTAPPLLSLRSSPTLIPMPNGRYPPFTTIPTGRLTAELDQELEDLLFAPVSPASSLASLPPSSPSPSPSPTGSFHASNVHEHPLQLVVCPGWKSASYNSDGNLGHWENESFELCACLTDE